MSEIQANPVANPNRIRLGGLPEQVAGFLATASAAELELPEAAISAS